MTRARAAVLALPAVLALAAGCLPRDFLIFRPEKTDRYTFPGNHIPLPLVEERTVTAADGVRLAAVLAMQPLSAARPTAVYFHGQAGHIDDAWPQIQGIWDVGYNVLAIDYRGYGKSEGEPSEEGLYLDARAAFDLAAGDPRLDPARLVLWSYSLGTGVASHLALEAPAAVLVLVAPFTSMTAMVEGSSPYAFPADWYTDVELDTLSRIGAVAMPVVVAHGSDDARVPLWMGEDVFAAARDPKRLVVVPGADHDDVQERGLAATIAAIGELVPSAVP